MLRKLALSLAIAGVLGVPNANALGLGEINIRSALNEPLNAEIRLMQVRDLSPLQIQPRMADADEFSIAGLNKSRFLNDVRFQVQVSPDGSGVIRMSSSEPVREPFLNFLVEVNWPNGRLVREYTVLLDPPVFDPAPISGQIQPAVTPEVSAAPQPVAPARAATPQQQRTLPTGPGQIHVGSNDTLWVLANRHRPDSSITPQQMMVALQRHNPQTFPTANINVMRAGTVMDIPSIDQIRALSPAEASAEVARQTEVWREGRARPAAATAPAPAPVADAAPAVADAPVAEEAAEPEVAEPSAEELAAAEAEALAAAAEALAEAELRIVTPEPEEVAAEEQETAVIGDTAPREESGVSAEVADTLLQRSEQLDTRLIMTEENLDRVRLENQDLKDSVASLQEQMALLQRMMELKDQQIAELQAIEAQPEPESSLVDKLTSLPVVGGLVAALIAALAALLLARRRGGKKTPEPMFKAPAAASVDPAVPAAAAGAAVAAAAVAEPEAEKTAEPEVEEVASVAEATDDFSDLDLDLDLDLELNETDDDAVRVIDEEYDLAAEDDLGDLLAETDLDVEEPVSDVPAEEPEADVVDEVTAEVEEEQPSLDELLDIEEPPVSDAQQTVSEPEEEDTLGSLDDLLMTESPAEETDEADELDDLPELQEASADVDADDLDFILQDAVEEPETTGSADVEAAPEEDDLDSLLGSLELEETDGAESPAKPGALVEEELTANIMHDLETDLDDELDDLLSSTDDEIALEESQSADEAIDMLDGLNLLDGADENETKLDLARAYLEMDDAEGAREILGEILAEGNDKQKQEAQTLLDSLN